MDFILSFYYTKWNDDCLCWLIGLLLNENEGFQFLLMTRKLSKRISNEKCENYNNWLGLDLTQMLRRTDKGEEEGET